MVGVWCDDYRCLHWISHPLQVDPASKGNTLYIFMVNDVYPGLAKKTKKDMHRTTDRFALTGAH